MSWAPWATVVDVGALVETALAALTAGVGLTISFAIAIHGAVRLADLRREGRALGAAAAGATMVAGLLVTLAGVGFGIAVMLDG